MIEQKDIELLADLLKLWKKYGQESFENLSNLLGSSEFEPTMARLISTSALVSEKYSSFKRSQPRQARKAETFVERQFSFMKASQPEKYYILEKFYKEAKMERVLSSRANALIFAAELGLNVSKNASRDDIINKIIRQLSTLPQELLEKKVKDALKDTKTKQTLDEWADIILKRKPSS